MNAKENKESHFMRAPVGEVPTIPSSVWRTRAQVRELHRARFSNSSMRRQWWHKYTRQDRRTNMSSLRPQGTCLGFSTGEFE